ncbi:MAG TPA: circadian clock protein KaiC [Dissulfurispiraceae bacterium]
MVKAKGKPGRATREAKPPLPELPKSRSGIKGLDQITGGGLPKGRSSLICGGAGAGKTLFAMEYLVKGATQFNENGVYVAFEETPEELIQNTASLGFHLDTLIRENKVAVSHIRIERTEIEVTGEFDLEGLFVRIGYLIDSIGAKRVVLDTLEALFASLPNEAILRAELRRLFRWLKDRGVTSVITAERGGEGTLTRHGIEEYVSDCVILLSHKVAEQISTRRLRIIKYRGTLHGTNEYPFLIERDGISILPITSVELTYKVSSKRVSSGIERLDAMLGGKGGYYEGSSILASGTAGTGKTSLSASFAEATCKAGGKCLYVAFEESDDQIMRNMKSIGIGLEPWVKKGTLRFHAVRPTFYGLEMHLVKIHDLVNDFTPDAVVVDPLSSLTSIGNPLEVNLMLSRLVDFLKGRGITAMFTNLAHPEATEKTEVAISSLIDTWLLLRTTEVNGERNRTLYILKSRGMAHSNQVREFLITEQGIQISDVYVGAGQVFTGSSRLVQEAKDKADALIRGQELEKKRRDFERREKVLEAQMIALRAEMETANEEFRITSAQEEAREHILELDRRRLSEVRKTDVGAGHILKGGDGKRQRGHAK